MIKATINQMRKRFRYFSLPNQKGQSIVIITFAVMGLIAMLGLALDLGLVYIERTRIKRAVDAAVLAGVVELPSEEQAFLRAINYLDENGYRLRDGTGAARINVYIRGCAHDGYLSDSNFGNYHDTSNPGGRASVDHNGKKFYLYFPSSGPAVTEPDAEFFIDTRTFQSADTGGAFFPDSEQCNPASDLLGTANKIHLDGIVPVRMNFMQFFSFDFVNVWDEAIAQNVTNLDVAVVFDMSGSMQFDTNGYGFYDPFEGRSSWPFTSYGSEYPIADFVHPIPVTHLPQQNMDGSNSTLTYGLAAGNTSLPAPVPANDGNLCWGRDTNVPGYYSSGGGDLKRYIIIEAELYSLNTSLLVGPFREPGRGFFAVQHTDHRWVPDMMNGDSTGGYVTGATPILNKPGYRSSWVSHHPYEAWAIDPDPPDFPGVPFGHNYTVDEVRTDPNNVPSLEYDFVTATDWDRSGVGGNNDDTRIWARIQRGGSWFDAGTSEHIFWAVYAYSDLYAPPPGANGDPRKATPLGSGQIEPVAQTTGTKGANYGGAGSTLWKWLQLTGSGTSLDLDNNTRYTLKIWAGGVGFDIDQIVIGNQNQTIFTSDYNNGAPTVAPATSGSAFRQACNRCNPIYGLLVDQVDCVSPVDNGASTVSQNQTDLAHPDFNVLFSGYEPVRGSKEAVKRFIRKLNPQFDQVGLAAYSTNTPSAGRVELRCRRYLSAADCFQGTNPISYTEVLNTLEILPPWGSTNMAEGMLRGLEMLGIDANNLGAGFDNSCTDATDHCSRGGSARRVMIVMTDGVANKNPWDDTGVANQNCRATDLYQPNVGVTDEDRAKDCAMFYAQIAGQNNVTIYTIGLGNGVDQAFLEAIATVQGSNGQYFGAFSTAQLDGIFDTILKSVSVRLIQ